MAEGEGERKKERVAFDLRVRTYEEATEVAAMFKTCAGGGGQRRWAWTRTAAA